MYEKTSSSYLLLVNIRSLECCKGYIVHGVLDSYRRIGSPHTSRLMHHHPKQPCIVRPPLQCLATEKLSAHETILLIMTMPSQDLPRPGPLFKILDLALIIPPLCHIALLQLVVCVTSAQLITPEVYKFTYFAVLSHSGPVRVGALQVV